MNHYCLWMARIGEVAYVWRVGVSSIVLTPGYISVQKSFVYWRHLLLLVVVTTAQVSIDLFGISGGAKGYE